MRALAQSEGSPEHLCRLSGARWREEQTPFLGRPAPLVAVVGKNRSLQHRLPIRSLRERVWAQLKVHDLA